MKYKALEIFSPGVFPKYTYHERNNSDLEQKLAQAAKELEVAVNKQRAAEDLANSFTGRDKKLKEQEELVANLREELKASVSEYNEKLSKLRSVMS